MEYEVAQRDLLVVLTNNKFDDCKMVKAYSIS